MGEEHENGRASDWIQRQIDHASATVASWPAWKRGDPKQTPEARITELEQSLAASEARVVELERQITALKLVVSDGNERNWQLRREVDNGHELYVALHAAASTAMRDGMMEAARIADNAISDMKRQIVELNSAGFPAPVAHSKKALLEELADAIRTRASSLPGGEGKS